MRLFAEALANLLPVCPCLSHLSLYHPPPLLLLTASGNGALSPIASSIHCALTDQPKKEKGTVPENTFANTAIVYAYLLLGSPRLYCGKNVEEGLWGGGEEKVEGRRGLLKNFAPLLRASSPTPPTPSPKGGRSGAQNTWVGGGKVAGESKYRHLAKKCGEGKERKFRNFLPPIEYVTRSPESTL